MSARRTVVFTTLSKVHPAAFNIASMLLMTCSVCASTSSPAKSLVCTEQKLASKEAFEQKFRNKAYPWHQPDLSGNKQEIAGFDRLGVRPNGARCTVCANDFFHTYEASKSTSTYAIFVTKPCAESMPLACTVCLHRRAAKRVAALRPTRLDTNA